MFQIGDIVKSIQNDAELYEIIGVQGNLATIKSVKYKTEYPHIPTRILALHSRSEGKYFNCPYCDHARLNSERETQVEELVCKACFLAYFAECQQCRTYASGRYLYRKSVIGKGDIKICRKCIDTFISCEDCGILIPKATARPLCPACNDRRNHPEARGFRREFNYTPKQFNFLKTAKDGETPVFLGIELECANIDNLRDNDVISYELTKNSNEILYCVFDSSINAAAPGQRDGNGVEIVSHPATWNWWKTNKKIVDLMMSIRDQGFRSYNARLCGMHIHISKASFTAEHLASFLLLFFSEAKFWSILSEKTGPELNRYANFSWNTASYAESARLLLASNTTDVLGSRYKVVNVTKHTVEVRHLRGALDENYFYKNLELVVAAFEYTKRQSEVSAKDFLDFVHKNRAKYPLLYRFLITKLKDRLGYQKQIKTLTQESVSPIVLHPCA